MNEHSKLTARQEIFVKHYIISFNATDAYRKAYGNDISDNVCAASSSRLLRNVNIKRKLKLESDSIKKRIEVDQDYVLEGLLETHKLGIDSGNLSAANKALELLGKHLCMFTDKVEAKVITHEDALLELDEERERDT